MLNPEIHSLKHIEERIINHSVESLILVLNTGALITPEAEAMIQALYSRSPAPVKVHLQTVAEKGPEKFMSTYYVGYGHQSIGDNGNTTVFIENVSMLAAKAFQDWALYSGQECSTRYIDFSQQGLMNPAGLPAGAQIQENWRTFYLHAFPILTTDLKIRFPKTVEEKDSIYEKAIKARAFDILRGFLPTGAVTSLAWHMNLRQAADQLKQLRHHPLEEVRAVANAVDTSLKTAFPGSFNFNQHEATENYNAAGAENYLYHDPTINDLTIAFDGIDRGILKTFADHLSTRPIKTELPRRLGLAGTLRFSFAIDFGSYRDIQRHRAVIQSMPLLTDEIGFESWYLDELTAELRTTALNLLVNQKNAIDQLSLSSAVKQYYLPMGYKISHQVSGTLPALIYLIEIRATRFVHQTLAVRAYKMGEMLRELFAHHGLTIHLDSEVLKFDSRRGQHDIIKTT